MGTVETIIADALFNAYLGYNDETISMMKMQSQYQRDADARHIMEKLDVCGFKVVRKDETERMLDRVKKINK